jgi:long-chain acyl-CoA synthetase
VERPVWEWERVDLPTVTRKFLENSEKYADKDFQQFNPALYNGDSNGSMTWKETAARVENYACGLMSLGLGKQEMAGIMSASGPYWTHADLAIACANGVSVAIYPTLSFKEASYIVNDSGSKFLFLRGDSILEMMLDRFDRMPGLEKIIVMDREYQSSDARVLSMGDLEKTGSDYRQLFS